MTCRLFACIGQRDDQRTDAPGGPNQNAAAKAQQTTDTCTAYIPLARGTGGVGETTHNSSLWRKTGDAKGR